jgi:hypothetical protein
MCWIRGSVETAYSPQRRSAAVDPQPNEGTWNRHIAPDPSAAPWALQYVCKHRCLPASQRKNSNADTRRCTQNTQMVKGPRLCQLPNVGNPRQTIKRVAHGVSAAPDHLHALRASAYICAESPLVPRCHRSRDAGRDHPRSRPVAASSVAALIFKRNDLMEGSRKSRPFRCLAEDSWQTARIFGEH